MSAPTLPQAEFKQWHQFCSKFVNAYPFYIRRDLIDQLNSLIWEAYVEFYRLAELKQINLAGFINNYVFYKLRDFAWKHRAFCIPRSSLVRNQKESPVQMELDSSSLESHDISVHVVRRLSRDPETNIVDIDDTLSKCCIDNIDISIISMLVEGYKRDEIIYRLEITADQYKYKLRGVRRRFHNRYFG